jgi:mRNA-degrading endonuclease RelE of RelBE toxin-antitoxin system
MPTRFTVQITPSIRRDLEALPAGAQQKILNALRQLEASPFGPTKVKKLKGKGIGRWRLEVWPYRVRYDVEGRDVVLYRVRHRKEVYREEGEVLRTGGAGAPGLDRGRATRISRILRRTRGRWEEPGAG